jgi:hypothetical protein
MKKQIYFLAFALLCLKGLSQPSVSPNEVTEICPEIPITLTFNYAPGYYINATPSNLKGVVIISNITNDGTNVGTATVKFLDQKGPHSFKVYNSWNVFIKEYVFSKIRTLDGIKPTFSSPPPGALNPVPPYWDDSFQNFPFTNPCSTSTFIYTSPPVKFKDKDGNEFGNMMSNYEWTAPKGWKIDGSISNGISSIFTTSPSVALTPDPITNGEIKVRARNSVCGSSARKPSNWYRVLIYNRFNVSLSVNGQNPISISCGDTEPRTFSIENIGHYPCANEFIWEIGSNWLLSNGIIAPSTLTTSTGSLTLKPSGTGAPGLVRVVPIVNGVATGAELSCSTNFINNAPNLTISGDNYICSGQSNYVLTGQTSLINSVTWSANPASKVILSPSSSSVTVEKVGDADVVLAAAVTNICNRTDSYNKIIYLGTPAESAYNIDVFNNGSGGPLELCPNNLYNIEASFFNSFPEYEWILPEGWVSSESGDSGPFITPNKIITATSATLYEGSFKYIVVRAKNGCGYGPASFLEVGTNCNGGYMGRVSQNSFSIYPNPANTKISIINKSGNKLKSNKLLPNNNIDVIVSDILGKIYFKKRLQSLNDIYSLDVYSLPIGNYRLTVIRNKISTSQILQIRR